MAQELLFPFTIFILFCLFSFFTGRGLLKLFFDDDQVDRIQFLFPITSLSFWAISIGIGVALYFPLRYIIYLLWIVSPMLVFIGARKFRPTRILTWVGSTALVLILSLPYVMHGFTNFLGSPAPDGWAYTAYGQYLWKYIRCTEGGLSPLYQYGAYLCHTRYIASSLLQFMSFIAGNPGISQVGMGYLLPWAFWTYSATLVFFIDEHSLGNLLKWVYLSFGVLSGWLFTALFANNFDNALAIGFLPAIVGLIQSGDLEAKNQRLLIILLSSAAIYIYPEISPFLIGSIIIFFWGSAACTQLSIQRIIFVGFGILLLLSPFLYELLIFLERQSEQVYAQVRPGGNLAIEIVSPRLMGISFWGFAAGEAYLASNTFDSPVYFWTATVIASLLTLFFVVGFFSLLRERAWNYITVQTLFSFFILYFIFIQNYGYGAYKIILLDWWMIVYFLTAGINKAFHLSNTGLRQMANFATTVALLAYFVFFGLRLQVFEKAVQYKSTQAMSDLQNALLLVDGHPLAVSVSNMTPNLWAVYDLRDHATFFYPYRSYPVTLASDYTGRAMLVPPESTSFLLTDFDDPLLREQAELVWQNPIYYLWRWNSKRWAYIAEINNPNSVETLDGKRFFWLGGGPTTITLISSQPIPVTIALETTAGPSLPEVNDRHLEVSVNQEASQVLTVVPGTLELPVSLQPGKNTITIQVLDSPSLSILPNGDPRPLLLGVRSIEIFWH